MSVGLLAPDYGEFIEAVARRVVELLDERDQRASDTEALVDAATLARLLGVSRATVYEHVDELGGLRLGDGARPRLRFNPQVAVEHWSRRVSSERSQETEPLLVKGPRRRSRSARSGGAGDLLPVKGPQGAV